MQKVFFPPVHEQTIFQKFPMRVGARMNNTLNASAEGLALPPYSHMTADQQETVCRAAEALLRR